jgi:PAS domain S-box-containing protein
MKIPSGIKVLVIDDDTFLRESICSYLEDSDFSLSEADNGKVGLDKFRSENPDVVLLDLRMPEMDGLELLPLLVKEKPETPVVIVSGMGTIQDSIEALRLGAWDYITKPIHEMAFLEHSICRALERAQMMRELRQYQEGLESLVDLRTNELKQQHALLQSLINSIPDLIFYKDKQGNYLGCNSAFEAYCGKSEKEIIGKSDFELFRQQTGKPYRQKVQQMLSQGEPVKNEQWLNYPDGRQVLVDTLKTPFYGPDGELFGLIGVSRDITERMQAEKERKQHAEELQRSLVQTIQAVAIAMEKRDPYTAGHQQRVSALSVRIGREMGLPEVQLEGLRLGSMIHDIGKISIPAEILNRPAKLSINEFEIIKRHSLVGWEIIKDISFPWPLAQMILQHHERFDGSGYPNGLRAEEIILEARIIAVADVVEAMASHRPYRASLGLKAAIDEITALRQKHFDPEVVDTCIAILNQPDFDFTHEP